MKKNKNTLFILIVLSFLFSLSLIVLFKLDSDYFWHIKAGEYMFKNGILKQDVFSWFVSSKYWMSHEWLFEILLYGLKILFGKYHVFIYSFISIFSLLLIFLLYNKKNYLKNIPFTLIWFLMFFLIVVVYIQARPHLFSFLFLAITIYLLYDCYKNEEAKKIYFLPFLTVFWANFHGGSSNLSYLLCLIFIIAGSFNFERGKIKANRLSKKQYFKYFVVMILCIFSICINIHGFKMLLYPYYNMLDKTMLTNIAEWRSTSLNEWYHYIFYFFLLLNILVLLFSKEKIDWLDLVLLIFGAYLGIKSIRFWMYLFIIMSFIIFNYIEERENDKGTFNCIIIISFAMLSFFLYNLRNFSNIEFKIYLDDETINIIKKDNPKRLFNMYDYGGELIYNDINVFIDGRADLYSKYNYKDYLNISLLKKDYVKLIEKYNFDYFLVDKDYPIYYYLKYNDTYSLIYDNKNLAIFKKSSI